MKALLRQRPLGSSPFACIMGIALMAARPAYAGSTEGGSLEGLWEILIDLVIIVA